jgi:hypothetical protein
MESPSILSSTIGEIVSVLLLAVSAVSMFMLMSLEPLPVSTEKMDTSGAADTAVAERSLVLRSL